MKCNSYAGIGENKKLGCCAENIYTQGHAFRSTKRTLMYNSGYCGFTNSLSFGKALRRLIDISHWKSREWLRRISANMCVTFWSMYLLSSMADLLEWSQEEDEAEGSLRKRQLGSCCCRSINCFIKLSLCHTQAHKAGGLHNVFHRITKQ